MFQVSANSHSLVNKVRSVVVTLLDSELSDNSIEQESTGEQYEGVLLSFLTLLTEIENVSQSNYFSASIVIAKGLSGCSFARWCPSPFEAVLSSQSLQCTWHDGTQHFCTCSSSSVCIDPLYVSIRGSIRRDINAVYARALGRLHKADDLQRLYTARAKQRRRT